MRKWVKYILFINSYTPLFIIFIIKKINYERFFLPHSLKEVMQNMTSAFDNLFLGYGTVLAIVISNLILLVIFKESGKLNSRNITAKAVNLQNSAALNYIATYIIPFLDVDFSKIADLVSLLLLFIVMGFVYVNSNLIYTNPTLMFMGYSIFEIEVENNHKLIVIMKGRTPNVDKNLSLTELTENIYLGRG